MRRFLLVGYGLCLILLSSRSHADAFRCGTQIVSNGDTTTEVRLKCGQPTSIEEWQEEVSETHSHKHGGHHATRRLVETITEWTYNRGSHQLIHVLRFRQGRLVDIKTAGYGS